MSRDFCGAGMGCCGFAGWMAPLHSSRRPTAVRGPGGQVRLPWPSAYLSEVRGDANDADFAPMLPAKPVDMFPAH